ncbi:MAG: M28 family metallopeptidase [Anaerolineaceae bacterium]
MPASQSDPFEILKSSILSRPRMMGTDGEKETSAFLLNFLTQHKLKPYTEDMEWSTAFVVGRKYLYLLMGVFVILFNLCLRLPLPWNGFLPISMVILSILIFALGMKGLTNDKYNSVGKTSKGKNVLCDIQPQGKKKDPAIIYFTAHSDSISSNVPKLYMPILMGMMLGFIILVLLTLTTSILNLISHYTGLNSVYQTVSLLHLIVLILSAIVLVCITATRFTKNVNTSPGACDNGSGSAILLSLAAYFNEHPLPNTQLKFIWCAAEEWGLYGSKGYVKAHKEEIAAHREKSCVINVDMVGSELAYLKKYGFPFKKPLNKDLNILIAQTAKEAGIEARSFNSAIGGNSDHAAFQKEKVEVCFFLANKDTKIIHSPQDTIEKVKPEKLTDAVVLIKRLAEKLDTDWDEGI